MIHLSFHVSLLQNSSSTALNGFHLSDSYLFSLSILMMHANDVHRANSLNFHWTWREAPWKLKIDSKFFIDFSTRVREIQIFE